MVDTAETEAWEPWVIWDIWRSSGRTGAAAGSHEISLSGRRAVQVVWAPMRSKKKRALEMVGSIKACFRSGYNQINCCRKAEM